MRRVSLLFMSGFVLPVAMLFAVRGPRPKPRRDSGGPGD